MAKNYSGKNVPGTKAILEPLTEEQEVQLQSLKQLYKEKKFNLLERQVFSVKVEKVINLCEKTMDDCSLNPFADEILARVSQHTSNA